MSASSFSLLTTLLIVFTAAIAGGIIAKRLKLPPLVGYITGGLILGNLLPRIIETHFLSLVAEAGITLLLFTLGVEFSFVRFRQVLRTVNLGAISQILFCTLFFLLLGLFLGLGFLPAILIALSGSISSTAVVVKILGERGELDTIPGEVATGWSIIQDLAVVPILLILPSLVKVVGSGVFNFGTAFNLISLSVVKSFLALLVIFILGRRAVPALLGKIAKLGQREIFGLSVLAIVILSAVLTYALGLPAALGAFIAGLIVAETSQNHAIFAEVRPLRDMFAVVFFVSLGLGLPFGSLIHFWRQLLILTVSIVFIKFGVVFFLARFLRYHRKTAFLVGLTLAQMSEFGFVIAQTGLRLGALSGEQATLLSALVFLTILVSTPLIANSHSLYYFFMSTLGRVLPKIFPVDPDLKPEGIQLPLRDHIVICGYGRVGKYIGRALEMAGIPFVVVDYNQQVVSELKGKGIPVVYGDPADKDVLDYAQVDLAKAIVIAIPDRHTQEMIIGNAQSLNRRIRIICRTHHEEDQRHLKSLGVTTIVQPEFEAAVSIVERLLGDFGVPPEEVAGKISRLKIEHGLG